MEPFLLVWLAGMNGLQDPWSERAADVPVPDEGSPVATTVVAKSGTAESRALISARSSVVLAACICGLWSIAVAAVPIGRGPKDEWSIGLVLGSLYGQAMLAAAWCVLGPGHLVLRWLLSPFGLLAAVFAFWVNTQVNSMPSDATSTLGICLFGQWAMTLFVLGLLYWMMRVRLDSGRDLISTGRTVRFRIQDILIVISLSAVFLAVGRIVLPSLNQIIGGEFAIFIFLSVAAVFITVPVGLSALMGRMALWVTPLTLLWVGMATLVEAPLFEQSFGSRAGPNLLHLIAINTVSTAVVLSVPFCLALGGYRVRLGGK